MKFLQMSCRQQGGVGTLFEIDYMLRHVVEPNEIVMAIVALRRCREVGEVEGGLEIRVIGHPSLDVLRCPSG